MMQIWNGKMRFLSVLRSLCLLGGMLPAAVLAAAALAPTMQRRSPRF